MARRSRATRARCCAATAAPRDDKGFTFYVAPDIEFFYFEPPEPGQRPLPLDEGGFFDLTTNDITGDLRKQTIRTLETMGIPVEYSFHEDAPEPAGDRPAPHRRAHHGRQHDDVPARRATRSPPARACTPRSCPSRSRACRARACTLHLSLFRGDDNAFYDGDDAYGLSPVAKSFMAGLLLHAAEITAITNQTVNSYKRLVPGFEAPVHVSWARNNRSGLIRVPIPKRGNPLATRIEYRSPDPACNPYLAFSVMLAAGMRGIEEGYELPVEADANLFEIGDEVLAKLGDRAAPAVAGRRAEGDGALRPSSQEALGEHIFEWFLRNKRSEWRGYKTHVIALRASTGT